MDPRDISPTTKKILAALDEAELFCGVDPSDPFRKPDAPEPHVVEFRHHSGSFADAEKWCKEHITGTYHWGLPNPFYWKFADADDAMRFKLVWG